MGATGMKVITCQSRYVEYRYRYYPGVGNGNPLQYPWLGNPMDRGAWWAIAHGVAKSQTQLSDWACIDIMSELLWLRNHLCEFSGSVVSDFAIPWTVACQASLSIELSRQEYWRELPFPTPGNLPNSWSRDPGIQPESLASLAWQACSLLLVNNRPFSAEISKPHRAEPQSDEYCPQWWGWRNVLPVIPSEEHKKLGKGLLSIHPGFQFRVGRKKLEKNNLQDN